MATADKALSILGLFTMEAPEWTVEGVMVQLDLSSSTAYSYVRSLVDAGLLVGGKAGHYGIGPAVIGFDRITRRHDPLIHDAQAAMRALVSEDGADAIEMIALLCRSFRSQVMCVDQYALQPTSFAIGYERGRPMPLYRGAASKAILAQLPARVTRRLWEMEHNDIVAAGLGNDWDGFKKGLRALRRCPSIMTKGEIDTGLVGISAPVLGIDNVVLGSLGIVALETSLDALPEQAKQLPARVAAHAAELSTLLQA